MNRTIPIIGRIRSVGEEITLSIGVPDYGVETLVLEDLEGWEHVDCSIEVIPSVGFAELVRGILK